MELPSVCQETCPKDQLDVDRLLTRLVRAHNNTVVTVVMGDESERVSATTATATTTIIISGLAPLDLVIFILPLLTLSFFTFRSNTRRSTRRQTHGGRSR